MIRPVLMRGLRKSGLQGNKGLSMNSWKVCEEKKYKAVFTDVDGTLVDAESRIMPLTAEAIRTCIRDGIHVVLISGRGASGIYTLLEEYRLRCPVIACSGSLVMDENRKILFSRSMPAVEAKKVAAFVKERGFDMSVGIYSADDWMVEDLHDRRICREADYIRTWPRYQPFDQIPDEMPVHKLLCICEPEDILSYEEEIAGTFPGLTVVKSASTLIEIMARGVDKSEALVRMCDYLGICPEETIAFGDSYNDLGMLKMAGTAVVMGNAPGEIRRQFDFVTKDNEHEGIYLALKKLGCLQ